MFPDDYPDEAFWILGWGLDKERYGSDQIMDTHLINTDAHLINIDTHMINIDTYLINIDTYLINTDTQSSNTHYICLSKRSEEFTEALNMDEKTKEYEELCLKDPNLKLVIRGMDFGLTIKTVKNMTIQPRASNLVPTSKNSSNLVQPHPKAEVEKLKKPRTEN